MTAPIPPIDVKIKFLHEAWKEHPLEAATPHSAGVDLRACIDEAHIDIPAGGRAKIPAGIAMEIVEPGYAGFVYSRSGLGAKHGLTVAQGVGVIDPDYRGEVIVWLLNTSNATLRVERGQRIAQLLIQPVRQARIIPAEELGDTDRGAGGFGHTGKI